jgi:hypothetical protein
MKELLVVGKKEAEETKRKVRAAKKIRPRYGRWPCPKRVGRKISIFASHLTD